MGLPVLAFLAAVCFFMSFLTVPLLSWELKKVETIEDIKKRMKECVEELKKIAGKGNENKLAEILRGIKIDAAREYEIKFFIVAYVKTKIVATKGFPEVDQEGITFSLGTPKNPYSSDEAFYKALFELLLDKLRLVHGVSDMEL